MPAEGEPHERTWMAWPSADYTLGEGGSAAEEAWSAWARVANAIGEYEPVTMLATSRNAEEARRRLSGAVTILETELDDAWYRDTGPTFVLSETGGARGGELGLQRLGSAGLGAPGSRRRRSGRQNSNRRDGRA